MAQAFYWLVVGLLVGEVALRAVFFAALHEVEASCICLAVAVAIVLLAWVTRRASGSLAFVYGVLAVLAYAANMIAGGNPDADFPAVGGRLVASIVFCCIVLSPLWLVASYCAAKYGGRVALGFAICLTMVLVVPQLSLSALQLGAAPVPAWAEPHCGGS